jgi:hypothetical protein
LHHYYHYYQVTADEINLHHVTYFINVDITLISGRFFPLFLIMPMFACTVGENIIFSDQQQNKWALKSK